MLEDKQATVGAANKIGSVGSNSTTHCRKRCCLPLGPIAPTRHRRTGPYCPSQTCPYHPWQTVFHKRREMQRQTGGRAAVLVSFAALLATMRNPVTSRGLGLASSLAKRRRSLPASPGALVAESQCLVEAACEPNGHIGPSSKHSALVSLIPCLSEFCHLLC